MKITEVRIKLMEDSDDRLQAFCSITFDNCFVVRDLKIIEGSNGPFVAMPSRKLTSHCPQCGTKNHLRSSYCNQCGRRLGDDRLERDQDGRAKLYADIAHPINTVCRDMIQQRVIREFQSEVERSQQPGYMSRYDEGYEDPEANMAPEEPTPLPARPAPTAAAPGQRTQIQPGEVEPRPPHQPRRHTVADNVEPARDSDQFGAGIFD